MADTGQAFNNDHEKIFFPECNVKLLYISDKKLIAYTKNNLTPLVIKFAFRPSPNKLIEYCWHFFFSFTGYHDERIFFFFFFFFFLVGG